MDINARNTNIRRLYRNGWKIKRISQMYQISRKRVYDIVTSGKYYESRQQRKSRKQREDLLKVIDLHWSEKSLPPTLRHIIENTSYSSTSVVAYNLRKLESAGLIKIVDRKPVPNWVIEKISA